MTTPLKARILKFGSLTCSACTAMARAKTLERFAEKYPNVSIVTFDISDEEGESPEGSEFAKNYALSDEYGVESLPTLILEIEGAGEVARMDGAANLKQLSEMWEEQLEIAERAAKLPWGQEPSKKAVGA